MTRLSKPLAQVAIRANNSKVVSGGSKVINKPIEQNGCTIYSNIIITRLSNVLALIAIELIIMRFLVVIR